MLAKASLIKLQKASRQCRSTRRATSPSLRPFAIGTTIMLAVATIRVVNIHMLAAPRSPTGPFVETRTTQPGPTTMASMEYPRDPPALLLAKAKAKAEAKAK